uniref:Putative secreted peptide n=1 Tax=Rhipicephalus pulchellus TaxID=72859 RepID=L7MA92_RHIPC
MIFVKCSLVLIATWTLYTQAKPTSHVTEQREDYDSESRDSGNFLISSRSTQDTEENSVLEKEPVKPHKNSEKGCFDGRGHRVQEGVSCAVNILEKTPGPQPCSVGICTNGTCIYKGHATCSDY